MQKKNIAYETTCNMMSVLDLMEVHGQAGGVYHCFDSDQILSILWNGNWE